MADGTLKTRSENGSGMNRYCPLQMQAEAHFCLHFFIFCDILIKKLKDKEPSYFAKEGLFVSQQGERKALFL